jgi:hypothetical protein
MKNKFIKSVLFISIVCSGCNSNTKINDDRNIVVIHDTIFKFWSKTEIANLRMLESYKDSAILNGNEFMYNRVASHYILNDNIEDLFYTAFMVANKYNNPEASYHVYRAINGLRTKENFDNLDVKSKNMALYYLLKSYESGFQNAISQVHIIFDTNKPIPKSYYYKNKF